MKNYDIQKEMLKAIDTGNGTFANYDEKNNKIYCTFNPFQIFVMDKENFKLNKSYISKFNVDYYIKDVDNAITGVIIDEDKEIEIHGMLVHRTVIKTIDNKEVLVDTKLLKKYGKLDKILITCSPENTEISPVFVYDGKAVLGLGNLIGILLPCRP